MELNQFADACHSTNDYSAEAIERKEKMAYEVFDVLWYAAENLRAIGYTLEEVAQMGLSKLAKRKAEGKIHGEGSNR